VRKAMGGGCNPTAAEGRGRPTRPPMRRRRTGGFPAPGRGVNVRRSVASFTASSVGSGGLHGRRIEDGGRRWCSAPANCMARWRRRAWRARARGSFGRRSYIGCGKLSPERVRKGGGGGGLPCPPWTLARPGP
jgi:hypothetical protein